MSTTATIAPTPFARFRGGEPTAFDGVVAAYASPAYAVALKVLGDPGLAEEATQEAFLRIWRNATRFNDARGNERTWILSVVRNQAIDVLRRRTRYSIVDIDDVPHVATMRDPADPAATVIASFRSTAVHEAVFRLPKEQRGVIQLAYFSGMRSVDIARQLNLPEGTVRSRIRLALGKLRTYLAEDMGVVTS